MGQLSDDEIRSRLGDKLLEKFGIKRMTRSDDALCFVKNERELTDDHYNWYELVQYMNDLLIEGERWGDLGITHLEFDGEEIRFGYST